MSWADVPKMACRERATDGANTAMQDATDTRAPYVSGATAPALFPVREIHVRPARRIDMIACLSGGFDLAEQQVPGHAARVASLAYDIAVALGLDAEAQRVVLHAGLLHDAGVSVRVEGGHTVGGAWMADLFGLDEAVQEAIRTSHERWDGGGRPLGLNGPDIPWAALCVQAAHWVSETAERSGNPLRARAEIVRTPAELLVPALGHVVAVAVHEVVRDDETWLAVWDDSLAARLALAGVSEGKPSRRKVIGAAEAMGIVVDSAVREEGRAARVASLARALGVELGLSAGYVEALGVAGLLLDIGQLGVPRYIADKPSILTVDEMEQMRRHPGLGARILERVPGMAEIASCVESHHERPDGRGYPEMLTGEGLPLAPRILSVADAYCALRADRPHRPAFSRDESMRLMEAGGGAQFDSLVVEALPTAHASAMEAEPSAWAAVGG
ncbi:MAG: HD domain-containing protein [Chloroflexi bacterium]|nr:HD domain-containing protein [Chloroflexota bacterium]